VTINRKLAAVGALAGALTLVGGLAAAGALPGVASDHATDATTNAGVTTPAPNVDAGDHPDGSGELDANDSQAPTTEADDTEAPDTEAPETDAPDTEAQENEQDQANGKGATISSIAHDPSLTGREKGAAVSDAASEGKSHAGEDHGSSGHGH
jgi:hypothetical protein